MKPILKDDSLQQQLDRDSYIRINLLSTADLDQLDNFYTKTPFPTPENDFFSTMHVEDNDYRNAVDQEIKGVMTKYVIDLMLGHKILFANFLYKKPASDSLVGIHQDWTYVDESQFSSINMWIPFVDVGEENGGLAVLKGSHKLTAPVRYTPYELPAYSHFFDTIEKKCEVLDVKRGEAVIYYSSLLHYSTVNRKNAGRLSMNMVVVPNEARPVHFYKKNDTVTKYLIDKDFFLNTRLFDEPVGYPIDPTFKYDPQHFSLDDLNRL